MAAEYYEYNNRNNNHEKDGTKKQPGENMNIKVTKEQQDKNVKEQQKGGHKAERNNTDNCRPELRETQRVNTTQNIKGDANNKGN